MRNKDYRGKNSKNIKWACSQRENRVDQRSGSVFADKINRLKRLDLNWNWWKLRMIHYKIMISILSVSFHSKHWRKLSRLLFFLYVSMYPCNQCIHQESNQHKSCNYWETTNREKNTCHRLFKLQFQRTHCFSCSRPKMRKISSHIQFK